jgi:hypothetical protein
MERVGSCFSFPNAMVAFLDHAFLVGIAIFVVWLASNGHKHI